MGGGSAEDEPRDRVKFHALSSSEKIELCIGAVRVQSIISPNIRVRHPDLFQVGEGSIVDDYCYFSTSVRIGRLSHVANNCSVGGGRDRVFEIGDFCSLSAGVRVWCSSDDFVNDLVTLVPPEIEEPIKEHLITGDVVLGHYTAVGSNSVIMPNNRIPEGTVIGALSYVPPGFAFEPWSVYAGVPLRYVRPRNRQSVLRQVAKLTTAMEHFR